MLVCASNVRLCDELSKTWEVKVLAFSKSPLSSCFYQWALILLSSFKLMPYPWNSNISLHSFFPCMKYTHTHTQPFWSRKWQPTPVILPGKFHGQRSLADYIQSMESQSVDTTERLSANLSDAFLHYITRWRPKNLFPYNGLEKK